MLRDEDMIVQARTEATKLIDADAELSHYPLLAAQVAVLASDERAEYLEKG